MANLLDAALAYAAQGIPVFPCIPGTKRPATPRGFHDATTDEATIRAWWMSQPDLNIAFSPHTIGQGIVDLDPPDGLAAWDEFIGYPLQTWTVRTPRGGLHLYFEGELPTSVKRIIPGVSIDTRGKGSYALLPPSVTPDGTYILANSSKPAPVPYVLAERVLAFKAQAEEGNPDVELDQPQNISSARKHLIDHPGGQEGYRNQSAFKHAATLRDMSISEPLALEMLTEWDQTNLPPLGDELALPIWSAYHGNAQNKAPGSKAVDPAAGLLASVAAPPPPEPAFKLRHPGQWSTLKRSPSLIDGMLPAQGTGVLYAPPGSFKSFIALGLAFAVATGKPAFGKHATSRTAPVVYCAGEGHLAVATQRLPALFTRHDVPMSEATPLYLMNGVPQAIEPTTAAAFIASIRSQVPAAPGLVVIDTMARSLAGLNENDASEAGRFVTLLETVASELECFVLAVGHEGKDSSKGVRGSSAVQAGVDVIWQAQRPSETSLGVSLHCRKDKDGDAHEVIYLLGEKFGGSMVFADVPEAEWKKVNGAGTGISPGDVGQALIELGAIEGKTVSTKALAQRLSNSSDDNIIDTWIARLTNPGFTKGRGAKKEPGPLRLYGTKADAPTAPIWWTFPLASGAGSCRKPSGSCRP